MSPWVSNMVLLWPILWPIACSIPLQSQHICMPYVAQTHCSDCSVHYWQPAGGEKWHLHARREDLHGPDVGLRA